MALQVKLVLLEPAEVEFLARGSTLELTGDVLLVVSNDPEQSHVNSYFRRGPATATLLD